MPAVFWAMRVASADEDRAGAEAEAGVGTGGEDVSFELPLKFPQLFANGVKKRAGILLYGPPVRLAHSPTHSLTH